MPDEAEVIAFPGQPTPTCIACLHASLGPVTYCSLYREEIAYEWAAAQDCPDYEDEALVGT